LVIFSELEYPSLPERIMWCRFTVCIWKSRAITRLGGLTPLEAIQTATIIPAKAMGLDSQTGTLEVGKEADIAILDKNPLDNIDHLRTVSATVTNGNYYQSDPLWEAADFMPRGN
jgi:imidazolonepropionase-like amidohydrolase